MLAIAQINDIFHYLYWTPSDHGPIITKYGRLTLQHIELSEPESLTLLFNTITSQIQMEIPVFTFSLDFKEILLSQTPVYDDIEPDEMVRWQLEQRVDNRFNEVYETFTYPFHRRTGKLLNIHFPGKIRSAFGSAMRTLKGEMRSINTGIFSAEMGARYWMKAGDSDSYAVWRMGKYNTDTLLIVQERSLVSLCRFRRSPGSFRPFLLLGDKAAVTNFFQDLENYYSDKLSAFTSVSRVFAYQAEGRPVELKKICESKIENIFLLNPLAVVDTEGVEKGNLYQTSQLAETGLSFRGIDV